MLGLALVFREEMRAQSDSEQLLLNNLQIQLDVTEAIDSLYNFNFRAANRRFFWLKQKYPTHPLPYFLRGLSEWWRIFPEIEGEINAQAFLAHMDTAIYYGRRLYAGATDAEKLEGAFFIATAYAYIAYCYAERNQYVKAAYFGKKGLNYLEKCRDKAHLSIEVLTGDALYNYYSIWLRENRPSLRLLMQFFRPGDKSKGLTQLRQVAHNAFYARTEAQNFLMKILYYDRIDLDDAWRINQYLRRRYPSNPYFHRYALRILHDKGRYMENKPIALDFMARLRAGHTGYGATGGRYAAYYLGFIHRHLLHQPDSAYHYYTQMLDYSRKLNKMDQQYTLDALYQLGDLSEQKKDPIAALGYYKECMRYALRKSRIRVQSKARVRALRRLRLSNRSANQT